ncbi:MAG: hypothetical protein ABMA64_26680 [Myxococcota bacterium]
MSRSVRVLLVSLLLLLVVCPARALAQGFGGWVSPGPLSYDHREIDTVIGCPNCHAPGQGPAPDRCMACHESVKKQVSTRTGFHAQRGKECESCHGEHQGRDHDLIPDLGAQGDFDHEKETGWPLEGAHEKTRCIECHTTAGDYTGLSSECASCHKDPHGKDQSKRDLLAKCDSCHDARDWDPGTLPASVFDHTSTQDADYLLDGLHLEVACDSCHVDARFVPLDFDTCTSCHVNPHRAGFRERACEDCHPNASTWIVQRFNHNLTKYPLEGEHTSVNCEQCHKGDKTDPIAFGRCETCHADLHDRQFAPRACDTCHTVQVAAFQLRDYDHDQTEYPLVGKHREQECEECHDDGAKAVYADLPHADCDECHEDAHAARFEPTNCSTCHISDGFEVDAFDHDQTDFPRTGKHIGLECNLCHRDYQWNDIPHASCVDCHYQENPHSEQITAEDCASCHTTEAFDQLDFDHVAETGFDLAPAHDQLACAECHAEVRDFAGLDSTCTACHQDDAPWGHYEGPCETCHTAARWSPAGLGDNDHGITGFTLVGAHSLEPCESCHPAGAARGLAEPDCASCHTRDDAHSNLLGTACADCHTEMSWLRTSWRHTTTGWPLRGAHRLAACQDCHATGFVATPTECFRCHETDAYACANPQCVRAHQSNTFKDCETCHVVWSWTTDRFPH